MPNAFASLHRQAEALLRAWTPLGGVTDLEPVRAEMLAALADDETAMWRENSRTHFTGSLLVFSPGLDRIALTLHGKAHRWFQFGGHFEKGDISPAAGALREGLEESGLSELRLVPGLVHIDGHDLPGAFGHCQRHLDLRFTAIASDDRLVRSAESDEVAWWSLDALPQDVEPSFRDAIALALDHIGRTDIRS